MLKTLAALAALPACLGAETNPVIDWNRNLLAIVRTPGAQPATIHGTRNFAIMHAAIYDAVNRIDGTHQPYGGQIPGVFPPSRSPLAEQAAAAAAAHAVLVVLYPAFQSTLDTELAQSLSGIPATPLKDEGVAIGEAAAKRILALRANDGAGVSPPPFMFGSGPGAYQSTPPNFPNPVFTSWSQVTPFTLKKANQLRPDAPPALTSQAWSDAINEVQSLGIMHGTQASPDQMLTGTFWNGAIQNYWNEIAQTAAAAKRLNTAGSARLFALLNLAFADCAVAFYDAKYTYQLWRPVTAIRAADTDNNPATVADPNWLPEVGNTPADPSYPGAHAVISAAGAFVLDFALGTDEFQYDVTSEVMPGITRSFTSFSAAAEEASLSRIFAGVHTRIDETAGERLGRSVSAWVTSRFLLPAANHGRR